MPKRREVANPGDPSIETDAKTGLPVIALGRRITADDVRSLDDD